jgi:hypothetical protein
MDFVIAVVVTRRYIRKNERRLEAVRLTSSVHKEWNLWGQNLTI